MRRDSKPELVVPRKASFSAPTGGDAATGWIVGLSVVGAEIESLQPPPAGDEVLLRTELAPGLGQVTLRGRVQWATTTQFAIQFGPLGARETRAIIEATRRSAA